MATDNSSVKAGSYVDSLLQTVQGVGLHILLANSAFTILHMHFSFYNFSGVSSAAESLCLFGIFHPSAIPILISYISVIIC